MAWHGRVGAPLPLALSGRQPNLGAQTAERAVAERDIAAVRAGDFARDGKAEAGPTHGAIATFVESGDQTSDAGS